MNRVSGPGQDQGGHLDPGDLGSVGQIGPGRAAHDQGQALRVPCPGGRGLLFPTALVTDIGIGRVELGPSGDDRFDACCLDDGGRQLPLLGLSGPGLPRGGWDGQDECLDAPFTEDGGMECRPAAHRGAGGHIGVDAQGVGQGKLVLGQLRPAVGGQVRRRLGLTVASGVVTDDRDGDLLPLEQSHVGIAGPVHREPVTPDQIGPFP